MPAWDVRWVRTRPAVHTPPSGNQAELTGSSGVSQVPAPSPGGNFLSSLNPSLLPLFSLDLTSTPVPTPATDWLLIAASLPLEGMGGNRLASVHTYFIHTKCFHLSSPCVRASLWPGCRYPSLETTGPRTFSQGDTRPRQGWAFLFLIINKNSTLTNIYI